MQKRNTRQKEAIFSSLCARRDHPSAAQLYEELKKKLPNISLATVYRVLNAAADEGEIIRLHVGAEDRFDGAPEGHCHVVCHRCNRIFDAPYPSAAVSGLEEVSGYRIERSHVEFYGLCPECVSREAGEGA